MASIAEKTEKNEAEETEEYFDSVSAGSDDPLDEYSQADLCDLVQTLLDDIIDIAGTGELFLASLLRALERENKEIGLHQKVECLLKLLRRVHAYLRPQTLHRINKPYQLISILLPRLLLREDGPENIDDFLHTSVQHPEGVWLVQECQPTPARSNSSLLSKNVLKPSRTSLAPARSSSPPSLPPSPPSSCPPTRRPTSTSLS